MFNSFFTREWDETSFIKETDMQMSTRSIDRSAVNNNLCILIYALNYKVIAIFYIFCLIYLSIYLISFFYFGNTFLGLEPSNFGA